jgi:hypothetical protein
MKGQVEAEKINLLFVKSLKSNIEIGSKFNRKDGQEYQLSIGQETGLNLDEKKIIFTLKVLIEFPSDIQDKTAKAEFVIQFLFEVENLNDLSNINDDGTPVVLGELSVTLTGIAYSTSRGIILNSTDQSEIGGVLLPVINPMNLLVNGKM